MSHITSLSSESANRVVTRPCPRGRGAYVLLMVYIATATMVSSGCAYTGNMSHYLRSGFKVGPNYRKPAAPVSGDWIDSYDERVHTDLPDSPDWWTVFDDPAMTELVNIAYEQNLPLREAGLRVLEARAQRGIAVGSFFPQLQEMFGSYTRETLSKETFPGNLPGSPRASSTWQSGGDLSWEIDVWGKFRRNIESADANLDSSVEDYDDILLCLLAETASTYIEYRTIQTRLDFLRKNVKIQEGALAIAQAKFDAGDTSELDVTQAQSNLRSTKRLIPTFENQLRLANNNLCVLLGIPPTDLSSELGDLPIPSSPPTVAVGVPANLLRRRPDVRAAEREAAAQSAQIGVAAADWFPSVTICGSVGHAADDFDNLFTQTGFTGFITPKFSWPILNYGRILNNVRIQDARFQQSAVNFQQTVLTANAEAENAINSFLRAQEALLESQAAVEAAEKSVELAMSQYRGDLIDFNRVFNTQLLLVQEQDSLATAQGDVPLALISLYKALGGGWEIRYGYGTEINIAPADEAEVVPLPLGEEG